MQSVARGQTPTSASSVPPAPVETLDGSDRGIRLTARDVHAGFAPHVRNEVLEILEERGCSGRELCGAARPSGVVSAEGFNAFATRWRPFSAGPTTRRRPPELRPQARLWAAERAEPHSQRGVEAVRPVRRLNDGMLPLQLQLFIE